MTPAELRAILAAVVLLAALPAHAKPAKPAKHSFPFGMYLDHSSKPKPAPAPAPRRTKVHHG